MTSYDHSKPRGYFGITVKPVFYTSLACNFMKLKISVKKEGGVQTDRFAMALEITENLAGFETASLVFGISLDFPFDVPELQNQCHELHFSACLQ